MLARSGPLPTRGDWAYEVKWDGLRAIVSTEGAAPGTRSVMFQPRQLGTPNANESRRQSACDGKAREFGLDGAPGPPCRANGCSRAGIAFASRP
jgi:hypothetical protein